MNELKEFYDSCVSKENGEYVYYFKPESLGEVISDFSNIHLSSIREHKRILGVSLDQTNYCVKVKVFGNQSPSKPQVEEVEVVEPKKWPTPAVDLTLKNDKWVKDCETPEDCEDGCRGDCTDKGDDEDFEGHSNT
jgi:hypothetical protein